MKNIAVVLFVLGLLSACSGTKNKGMSVGADQATTLMTQFEKQVGDRVYFKYDSSDVTEVSRVRLAKQAEWLREHPGVNIVIEGHCDERGTREYNLALGDRRANSVKRLLVDRGVADTRVEVISYGKERPAAIGVGEDVWKLNRRAVTVVGR